MCCAAGSREPGPRAGGGAANGGGGAAVRTSVAFTRLAAPIRLPVTHPPSPRSMLRGPAQAMLRARTPSWGLWVPCPRTCWGLGSSRSPFPDLWHPGGCTASVQPLEKVGKTEGRGRTTQGGSRTGREGLTVPRGGLRETPAHHKEGDEGRPPDPRGGAARAAGEGAVTQPPSARLPGTLQQLEPPLLQERKAFVPQCQGCQGKREAGRLPLPGGT